MSKELLPYVTANISEEEVPRVKKSLNARKESYRKTLENVLIPSDQIDSRVISLIDSLQELNRKRLSEFGLPYEEPEIFFVDRAPAMLSISRINHDLEDRGIYGNLGENAASYDTASNFVTLFVNNFDDPDVDAYGLAIDLRHELSHAGGFKMLRKYPAKEGVREQNIFTRSGGFTYAKQQSQFAGLVFDEGHRTIEDSIFAGENDVYQAQDPYLNTLPVIGELFPGTGEKFAEITEQTIGIPKDHALNYNKKNNSFHIYGYEEKYTDYMSVMEKIYSGSPELYGLATDFIYGGQMLPFARRINQVFGSKFFTALMQATDHTDAKNLLERM